MTTANNTLVAIVDDAIAIGEPEDRTIDRLHEAMKSMSSSRDFAEDFYKYGMERREGEWEDGTRDVSCQQLTIEAPSWHVATGLPRGIVTPTGQRKLTVHATGNEVWQFLNDREVKATAIQQANKLSRENMDRTRQIAADHGIDFDDNAAVILSKVRQLELFDG